MRNRNQLIRELQQQLVGRVNDPFDAEYRDAIAIDNGRVIHEPSMVVVPENVSDVQRTLAFCVDKGLKMTTKAGGHSATGYCLNTDGVVLDLRRLNSIQFNAGTGVLRAGLGCRWREIYDFLENGRTGRIPVGGGCPGVGLAGFLLGGGFSFVSRSYGLGCDHIRSLSLITPDSKVHTLKPGASQSDDASLLWACCGGGGGNFGVAVDVEIQTQQPKTDTMLMGEIKFPLYRIAEVLPVYNVWSQKLPRELAVYGRIAMVPNDRGGGELAWSLIFTPVYNGDFSRGAKLLEPLIRLDPLRVDLHRMTIQQWEHYIGLRTTVAGRSAYMRSLVTAPGSWNDKAAAVLMKYFAVCPSPDSFMVWTQVGGEVARRGTTATAFPHRSAAFVPELKAIWQTARPQDMRRNVEWAYDFYEELATATNAAGAYVNYIDPLLTGWSRKYYGENYDRLVKVRRARDPDHFFSFQQSIDSAFEPASYRDVSLPPAARKPLDLSPLRETFFAKV